MAYLDDKGLIYLWGKIKAALSQKLNAEIVRSSMYQQPTYTQYRTRGNLAYDGADDILDQTLGTLLGDAFPDNPAFVINGVTVGVYTQYDTLRFVLNGLNDRAEAGVTAEYNPDTREFLFTARTIGAGHNISMGEGLAQALFDPPEGGQNVSFAEAYGISWLKDGETEKVTFAISGDMAGQWSFDVSKKDTIQDVANKLNQQVQDLGYTAAYNKYTGQLGVTDRRGNPVELSMRDHWDDKIKFDEEYAPASITYTNGEDGIFTAIKVNGKMQPVVNRTVKITVPTGGLTQAEADGRYLQRSGGMVLPPDEYGFGGGFSLESDMAGFELTDGAVIGKVRNASVGDISAGVYVMANDDGPDPIPSVELSSGIMDEEGQPHNGSLLRLEGPAIRIVSQQEGPFLRVEIDPQQYGLLVTFEDGGGEKHLSFGGADGLYVTHCAEPESPTMPATKGYVDTAIAGARGEHLGSYSTEETRIGTWIDGKPLYRRVIQAQLFPGMGLTRNGLYSDRMLQYVNVHGFAIDQGLQQYALPYIRGSDSPVTMLSMSLEWDIYGVLTLTVWCQEPIQLDVTVIAEYTKIGG